MQQGPRGPVGKGGGKDVGQALVPAGPSGAYPLPNRPDTGATLIDPLAAQDVTAEPSMLNLGIRGIANWGGIMLPEPNPALQLTAGYGLPGNQVWGVWEQLARTNAPAAAALEMVTSQVRDARVEVEQNDENPDQDLAEKQATYLEDNLHNWLEPLWPQAIQSISWGMMVFGFNLQEVVYGVRDDKRVPGGKGYYVRKLAERMPSTIRPDGWMEKNDELAVIRQIGQKDGSWYGEVDLPANKVLLFTLGRVANNYVGFSALRSIYYPCQVWAELVKMLGIKHARESLGMPTIEVDKDARWTTKMYAAAQRIVQNITYHENAGIVLPAGGKLVWQTTRGEGHSAILETMQAIKLLVFELFQTQQAALGSGAGSGSRAVGNVHQAQKIAFVEGVLSILEAVLNGAGTRPYEGLVGKILRPNWGDIPFPPRIKLTLQQSELSPVDFATAVGEAVQAGVLTPTTDVENTVRQKLGMEPIDDAQRDAERQKAAALAPKPLPGAPAPGQPAGATAAGPQLPVAPRQGATPPKNGATAHAAPVQPAPKPAGPPPIARIEPKPGLPGKLSKFSDEGGKPTPGQPFKPHRALRPEERVLAFQEMTDFLDAAPQRFEDGAKPLVVELLARAVPAIRAAKGDTRAVQGLQLFTDNLKAFCRDFIAGAAGEGHRQVAQELQKSAGQVDAERKAGKPRNATGFRGAEGEEEGKEPEPTPAEETSDFVDVQTETLTGRIVNRVQSALEREAIDVDRTGGDADEIVSEVISDTLDAATLQADARTVLTKAFNMGRQQFADERGDQVEKAIISALLDRNTCDYCEREDGEELEFGTPEEEELTPPLRQCAGGDSCRCIKVFVFKGAQTTDEPEEEEEEEPEAENSGPPASMPIADKPPA